MPRDTEGLLKSEDSRGHQSYHTAKLMDVRIMYIDLLLTYYDDFLLLPITVLQIFPNLSNKLEIHAELQGLQQ